MSWKSNKPLYTNGLSYLKCYNGGSYEILFEESLRTKRLSYLTVYNGDSSDSEIVIEKVGSFYTTYFDWLCETVMR